MDRYRRKPELKRHLGVVGPYEFQGTSVWTNPFVPGPMAWSSSKVSPETGIGPPRPLSQGILAKELFMTYLHWRKNKGQQDEGQQDLESPRGKSSSERVSERTSEPLRGFQRSSRRPSQRKVFLSETLGPGAPHRGNPKSYSNFKVCTTCSTLQASGLDRAHMQRQGELWPLNWASNQSTLERMGSNYQSSLCCWVGCSDIRKPSKWPEVLWLLESHIFSRLVPIESLLFPWSRARSFCCMHRKPTDWHEHVPKQATIFSGGESLQGCIGRK